MIQLITIAGFIVFLMYFYRNLVISLLYWLPFLRPSLRKIPYVKKNLTLNKACFFFTLQKEQLFDITQGGEIVICTNSFFKFISNYGHLADWVKSLKKSGVKFSLYSIGSRDWELIDNVISLYALKDDKKLFPEKEKYTNFIREIRNLRGIINSYGENFSIYHIHEKDKLIYQYINQLTVFYIPSSESQPTQSFNTEELADDMRSGKALFTGDLLEFSYRRRVLHELHEKLKKHSKLIWPKSQDKGI